MQMKLTPHFEWAQFILIFSLVTFARPNITDNRSLYTIWTEFEVPWALVNRMWVSNASVQLTTASYSIGATVFQAFGGLILT
jgi:hypothetical protein